ncbi:MAG: type II secretion system F family protein [Actinomycetota bacterium]|nr:type II secretion system F family protein [Actinomycetota bacterium]
MSAAVAGAALGLVGASGLWLAAVSSPPARRTRLDGRLAPYLRDTPRPSRLLVSNSTLTPFPTLERLMRPVLADLMAAVERWVGGATGVRKRLDQAGGTRTVEQFRAEQVIWGAFGLAAGLGLSLLSVVGGTAGNPVALLLTCVAFAVAGVLGRDRWLSREVAQREARLMAEFPTIAELLALAVTAGEGPVAALERVTRIATGELTRELSRCLADARSGASLIQALEGLAQRTSLPQLARFVDGVTVAVERGTPLAEVLRAQAVDVREAGKRQLLETAGRREVAMMLPVVFLILPTTVCFALYPGFYGLRLVAG